MSILLDFVEIQPNGSDIFKLICQEHDKQLSRIYIYFAKYTRARLETKLCINYITETSEFHSSSCILTDCQQLMYDMIKYHTNTTLHSVAKHLIGCTGDSIPNNVE